MKDLIKVASVSALLVSSGMIVFANSGSFDSTYNIAHGTAGYGLLDSRIFDLATDNRSVTVTMTPTSGRTVTIVLRRQGFLGMWSYQGNSHIISNTETTVRTLRGGAAGNHRLRIFSTGNHTFRTTGSVSVSW